MFRKNLFFIATIGLAIALTSNVFGQSTKKAKSYRTANRIGGNLKPRVKNINDQTPADWNERQSGKTQQSEVKTAVKKKAGNALDAGFTLSDDLVNEAKTKRPPNGRTNQRRAPRTRNLQPENGGFDPTDERPEFNPAANRQKNTPPPTTQQSNILPYIEQQNIIKKKSNNASRYSSSLNRGATNRTKSRKKYANQEVGYRKRRSRK
jgi:hypothetical protein